MFIAFKEIRASLGRFLLLIGAVMLLVVLLLFFQSVAGSLTLGITGGIENNNADVLVFNERARGNPAASFLNPGSVDEVGAVEGVASASAVGRGIFSVAGADEDVVIVGLEDQLAGPAVVDDGRRPNAPGEALVSTTSLAEGFAIGDVLTVEGMSFEAVGVTDEAAFDVSTTLYVSYSDFAAVTQTRSGGQAPAPLSWVAVAVDDGLDPATVAERITETVGGIEALDRSTAANELPGADQITQSFSILYLLLFIVVTIVTGVFFLILTVQKQRSLVLLRAIGGSRWDVVKPVLIQVVIVVGLGVLLGVAVAGGLLELAKDVFGSSLDPRTTILTSGFILALGILASLGAIRRVLSVDPIEATTGGSVA